MMKNTAMTLYLHLEDEEIEASRSTTTLGDDHIALNLGENVVVFLRGPALENLRKQLEGLP